MAVILTIVKRQKQLISPSTDNWIYTIFTVRTNNRVLFSLKVMKSVQHAITQMNLENMLSEISQKQ